MPLTSSVYVPGKLKSPDDLLVDVGTGFYVKKNRASAGEVMDTKTKFVKDKADEVQRLTELKARQLSEVNSGKNRRRRNTLSMQCALTCSCRSFGPEGASV